MNRILIIFILSFTASLHAAYTIHNGEVVNTADIPKFSADKHYELGCAAMEESDYVEAAYHFNIISKNFTNAEFHNNSVYYLGICYFNAEEYDFANEAFGEYLRCQSQPEYFENAICYKLEIANRFRMGAKKRFFGTKALPKWAPARTAAVEIYNEVIAAIPCHDFAAQALWGKANLLWEDFEFRDSIETFQQLIRRFPKHELAPCAYLSINHVYLDQAQCEFQNPDLLVLAQINVRKFEKEFPKDERVVEAQADVQAIKELYAKGLFETAQFYERTDKPQASILYYRRTIEKFPDTSHANCSRNRLRILGALDSASDTPCDPS